MHLATYSEPTCQERACHLAQPTSKVNFQEVFRQLSLSTENYFLNGGQFGGNAYILSNLFGVKFHPVMQGAVTSQTALHMEISIKNKCSFRCVFLL